MGLETATAMPELVAVDQTPGMALNVALRPSPPGYAGYARARPSVSTPAAPYKMTPAAKPQPKTPMPVFVGSLEDWLRPEATSYQALHFPRSPSWPNYQMEIDRSLEDFGPECQLERKIEREPGKDLGFKQAAEELLRSVRLPKDSGRKFRESVFARKEMAYGNGPEVTEALAE
eukprot:s1603_g20.t1